MALDDLVHFAVHRRQRARQDARAGFQCGPLRSEIAIGPLHAAAPRKAIGDFLLIVGQNVDAEMAEAADHGQVEEERLIETTMVSGSTESEWALVTVAPVRSSPVPAVTTDTAPARWRMASFSCGPLAGSEASGAGT